MAINGRWGHFDGSDPRPVPKDPKHPTDAEEQAAHHWDREDDVAGYLMSQRLPDEIILDIEEYTTTQEQWDALSGIFTAKTDFMQMDLHQSFMDMKCPRGGDIRKFLTDLRQQRHHLTAIGIPITDIEYKRTILHGIPEPLALYASQTLNSLTIASRYTCKPVDISELIDMISEEAERAKSRRATKDQTQAQGKGKSGQSDEALTATNTSEGGSSKRRKGKCHHCGKEGHWVRECRTKKREEATAENQSGQTTQASTSTKPENKPVGSANVFEDDDSDDDGFCMAEEDVARAYPYCAEPDPLGESEDESDDDVDEWEAFRAETWGAEDEDDLDWAGLEGPLVKEGEETDVEEEAEEGTPRSESQLAPRTALHAPQIGDGRLQTTSSCREQVADTVRHAHRLHDAVRPPEHAHLDDPEQVIRACKGQTPGFNANAQAHRASWPGPGNVTEEQDIHPASAALLKGEEMWMPSMSSEQTAAPGTPSTSNALTSPASPSKATPSSSEPAPELDSSPSPAESVTNAQQERAPTPSRTDTATVKIGSDPDPQPSGNGLAHLGTDDPRLAHIPDHPGAFAEDPGESGGVPTVENSASSPLADPDGAASTFAAETADAGAPAPCTLAEAKRSHDRPPWEEPTESPVTHKARPAAQVLSQTGGVDIDDPNQSDHGGHAVHPPQPAHIDAAFPHYQLAEHKLSSPPVDHLVRPLTDPAPASAAECDTTRDVPHREAVNTLTRAASPMCPATTSADASGIMAIYRRATSGHAFPIDGGTMPPFSRQQEDAPSPTIGSGHIATTHGGQEASCLRSPVSGTSVDPKAPAPPFPNNDAAIAFKRDHPSHTPDPLGHQERKPPGSRAADDTVADAPTPLLSAMEKHFAASPGPRAK